MKTITCVTPGELIFETDKEMPTCREGEALVRIKRIGICGTDLHAYAGRQPFFSYPRVLGHELGAEIVEIGENSDGLAPGDNVAIVPYIECGKCIACRSGRPNCCTDLNVVGVHSDGGMTEYMTVPADHLIKNSNLSQDQLAMTECLAIGAHAVRRAEIKENENVLVIGAGPIGFGLMQFAGIAGGKVIAMDISQERLQFAKDHAKVDHIINAGSEDVVERLAEITGGDNPTVIFDATGNPQSMMDAFLYLAHTGRYILVSLVTADITFPDPEFHKRETTLLSSRNATKEDFLWVMECMEKGLVVTEPMITHRCGFDNLLDNFKSWLEPESKVIKAVVEL